MNLRTSGSTCCWNCQFEDQADSPCWHEWLAVEVNGHHKDDEEEEADVAKP
jgi:hypothetical protein